MSVSYLEEARFRFGVSVELYKVLAKTSITI